MDILKQIEEIAKKGYSIEYIAVDQQQNGNEKQIKQGLIKKITYTVYIIRLKDSETVYTESKDCIEDCLEAGINFVKTKLLATYFNL
ncbi:hypothetical protein [Clostridium algidicarnis]|uniref:Uncharacterized protein n=2 Tax=Clostridium algidicarnis TaxID=37659 RepID=A0A2S6FUM1_9CLOT|nr:hypothetical protein [Clostridium algidicarnis]MBU3220938.1 hypothetical protein [Clostridium algidicarnis]PPK44145.1 hypothetical protein BD821_12412 [Clostridium algidicarnis DSM 15099]